MIISFKVTSMEQMDAYAQIIDLIHRNNMEYAIIPDAVPTSTHVNAPTTQPKAEKPKAIPTTPATDVELPVTMQGKDGFTLGYGSGRAGAKMFVKSCGFRWDAEKRMYCGGDFKALALKGRGANRTLTVSAEWVQKGRDKAEAKANRG